MTSSHERNKKMLGGKAKQFVFILGEQEEGRAVAVR